jgi:hypothetical protein
MFHYQYGQYRVRGTGKTVCSVECKFSLPQTAVEVRKDPVLKNEAFVFLFSSVKLAF